MQPRRRLRAQRVPSGQRQHASRRLRDLLRSNIHWDFYPDGLLPSELELMVSYDASRATVREALTMLRQEGVIDRQQGTGTFVISRNASMQLLEAHGVSRPEHNSIFDHHRTLEIDRSWMPTPEVVASRLGSEAGAPCLRLEYLASRNDNDVFALATNYVIDPEATAIGTIPLGQSWYGLLDLAGLTVGESEFVIGCVNADEHTASVLSTEVGTAMLTMEQVIRDYDGRAYNFAFVASRGDRHSIVSRAQRSTDSAHTL
jgi:GntR family transcriptional regulator